jgi:Fe-S-cluster containining protein
MYHLLSTESQINGRLQYLQTKANKLSVTLKENVKGEYDKVYNTNVTGNQKLSYHLNPSVRGITQLGVPCIFLDEAGKCEIYAVRPFICRKFGTVTDSTSGEYFICDKATYRKTQDFSNSELSKEASNISIVDNYVRLPKPLFYWFDEIVPLLMQSELKMFHQMYLHSYTDVARGL